MNLINILKKSNCLIRIIYKNKNYLSTTTICKLPRFFNGTQNLEKVDVVKNEVKQNEDFKILEEIESNFLENEKYKPISRSKLIKELKTEPESVKIKNKRKVDKLKSQTTSKEIEIIDSSLGFRYKKLNINDPLISKLFIEIRGKKNKNKEIIVEGWRLIKEALNCGLKLEKLFFIKKENLNPILDLIKNYNGEFYKVPQQTLRTWSCLTSCPGLIGIFKRNVDEDFNLVNKNASLPITVVCDNIREPNNLGSIVRTCAAVPCNEVILMKGCCNPWESKALRGGCGGQFYINIKDNILWENLDDLIPKDSLVLIAENNLKRINNIPIKIYNEITISNNHNCVIIGGETEGISRDAYRFLQARPVQGSCINIPLAEGIDSLNTSSALTLILFEIRKHLLTLKNNKSADESS